MNKLKYSTYLFDFDGTLVDSMPAYVGVMLRILNENSMTYPDDIVKVITPLGFVGTAKYFIDMGLDMTMEKIIDLMNRYALDEYLYNIPAKSNVIDVLKKLKEHGAKLNVLTASPHLTLDPCLKRLGIYDLFDNVWSCEDFNTTKADPEIYKMAAAKIGVPIENMLFLDDNYNADKTAKEAGAAVCGVYDKSSDEYTNDIKRVADYYISDFTQLMLPPFID